MATKDIDAAMEFYGNVLCLPCYAPRDASPDSAPPT